MPLHIGNRSHKTSFRLNSWPRPIISAFTCVQCADPFRHERPWCGSFFYINTRPTSSPKTPHKVHLYRRMDLAGIKHEANNISREFFFTDLYLRTVNENWILFKDKLHAAIDAFVPHKLTKSKYNLPWLTKSIKRQMRKRDRLHSLVKHINNATMKAAYRKQRNKVVALLRSSHTNYLCNEIGESASGAI